jgi:hypothetical protein
MPGLTISMTASAIRATASAAPPAVRVWAATAARPAGSASALYSPAAEPLPLKACFHQADDGRQIRPRVQQPDRGFHGEGATALLDDAALAVILADDDERTARDPREARLESASEATLVPTIDFQVTAPRSG